MIEDSSGVQPVEIPADRIVEAAIRPALLLQ